MQIGGENVHGVKWAGKREVPALKTKDEQDVHAKREAVCPQTVYKEKLHTNYSR